MEEQVYHVRLDGRTLGPYDRRTIVGMRIKNALSSEHVLIGADGQEVTVGDLIRMPREFNPARSGSFSVVQATFTASLVDAQKGWPIPAFKGEMQARVQRDVLRLAGRFRRGFRWKEDRVKVPLDAVAHVRTRGSLVDLWLRTDDKERLQRVTLELFSPESSLEFVEWFPGASAYPGTDVPARPSHGAMPLGLIAATVGVIVTVCLVLTVLMFGRVH